jgi:hypothetical protein
MAAPAPVAVTDLQSVTGTHATMRSFPFSAFASVSMALPVLVLHHTHTHTQQQHPDTHRPTQAESRITVPTHAHMCTHPVPHSLTHSLTHSNPPTHTH